MTLRLIAGLGNPGAEYSRTRHNAGFWFIEALAEHLDVRFGLESKLLAEVAKARVGGENLLLVKPLTFMNRSGQSLSALERALRGVADTHLDAETMRCTGITAGIEVDAVEAFVLR